MRSPALGVLLIIGCTCPPSTPVTMMKPPCTRLTCTDNQCGEQNDGCGGILRCPACPAGLTCGGGGQPNFCAPGSCSPKTCLELKKNCDFVSDGCSKLLDCGRCARPADCGLRVPNVCGGASCLRRGCGTQCNSSFPDDCGGTTVCDAGCIVPFFTCGGGSVANVCGCTPLTCAQQNKNCGRSGDGCGTMLDCGGCGPDAGVCGGGGFVNVCGGCSETHGRTCSSSCWCWEDPRPFGAAVTAITGAGGDVWLMTNGGDFFRYRAGAFTAFPTGLDVPALGAWAASPTEVYAVSNQTGRQLVGFDGTAWASAMSPVVEPLNAVWVSSSREVWAVGPAGNVVRRSPSGQWVILVTPTGATYDAIWGSAANDVWVGGTELRHWDGVEFGTELQVERVRVLHGTAANDVWAATASALRHYDGTSWAVVRSSDFRAVFALGPTDVWAADAYGAVLHLQGSAVTRYDFGEPATALWAAGADDVWLATTEGVYRYDGNQWRPVTEVLSQDLKSVHTVSATEVWAVGPRGHLVHGDGAAFSPVLSGVAFDLEAVSGAGGRVWAVGGGGGVLSLGEDGGPRVERPDNQTRLHGVFALSSTRAWAVGQQGEVLVTDGSGSWSALPRAGVGTLTSVWASRDDDVWVAGGSDVYRTAPDGGWALSLSGFAYLQALWGFPDGERFVAGQGIARYSDAGWSLLPTPGTLLLNAVWGSSARDVYFAGDDGALLHWDGSALAMLDAGSPHNLRALSGVADGGPLYAVGDLETVLRLDVPGSPDVSGVRLNDTLLAIHGASSNDVWAVGTRGRPYQWNGATWSTHETPQPRYGLAAVWAAARDDVWAAGLSSRLLHFDGTRWTPSTPASLVGFDFRGLWGSPTNEVFLVGSGGVVGRHTATGWTRTVLANGNTQLNAVSGTASNDVWAVGDALWHFDGTTWQQHAAPTPFSLTSVSCAAREVCWAVGTRSTSPSGVVLRFDGAQWAQVAFDNPSPWSVFARSKNDVFVFTGDGVAWHWDGQAFSPQRTGARRPLVGSWGDATGTWVVGDRLVMFHATPQ